VNDELLPSGSTAVTIGLDHAPLPRLFAQRQDLDPQQPRPAVGAKLPRVTVEFVFQEAPSRGLRHRHRNLVISGVIRVSLGEKGQSLFSSERSLGEKGLSLFSRGAVDALISTLRAKCLRGSS